KGKPWLLNFFDQIRFFPVSNQELTEARAAFPHGGYPIRIEETEFSYASYEKELQANAASIGRFKATPKQPSGISPSGLSPVPSSVTKL
ncbi:hypothetical protein ACC755_37555, partial [Rhizobium ruizarguesonis]